MADRVNPPSKPSQNPPQNPSSFPAPKSQLYGPSRPLYRPNTKSRRRSAPSCCFCFLLVLLSLFLLFAAAGAGLWFFYRPHRPSYSVSALRISSFSLSSSKDSTFHLSSQLSLSLSAKNPNKKLLLFYDPFSVSVLSSSVPVAVGSIPAFSQGPKNTTTLGSTLSSPSQGLDSTSAASIRSDLKRKEGLPLQIKIETKVSVKVGPMKMEKVKILVSCDGINGAAPKGKSASVVDSSASKCEVQLRFKIWKWQL